jgi:imidazolonepropionase-like amidohydrolase
MLKTVLKTFTVFVCIAISMPAEIKAQNSDTPKPLSQTYYLKNCFVVKQPGVVLSGQNVVIKDAFITEVGQNLKIPFDAQVVQSDSMYVYAGFIDAYSNTGIVKPENKERSKVQNPGNPPNDIAGITPQNTATETFKSSEKSVADMRAAGFCISHVVPRGMMLPGQSGIFLLGEGANDKMVLKSPVAQNFQFEAGRGVYPSTSIAVIAKWRELYKNASIAGQHEEKFRLNPAGLSRPDYTKELVALYPVTNKKLPLYVVARQTKDVHKAISLKEEQGFDLVLTEVKQGWHYKDKIKKSNIPVLLSSELPEDDKKEVKKDDKGEEKKDTVTTNIVKKEEKKDPNPERDAFDLKRQESLKQYNAQAGVFEKEGIKFGFSYLNVKSGDIKKNLRKMIENGLSENAALSALTIHPAQILGISQLAGTVEKGKVANLVVTDKPYFDEKSTIKYVFVDGQKYDYTEKPKKADNKPSEAGKLVGVWTYTVEIPGSTQRGKINIKKSGGEYKITVVDDSTPNDEDTASDININGNNITFYIMADMGQPVKVDFDLNFDTKSYKGSISVAQFGNFPIKGEFESDPKL